MNKTHRDIVSSRGGYMNKVYKCEQDYKSIILQWSRVGAIIRDIIITECLFKGKCKNCKESNEPRSELMLAIPENVTRSKNLKKKS